jgi:hypothetical protein
VARNALKSILGDETAAEIEKQVDAGKLSLADLNALEDKGKDISTGVLSLIFGTPHPQEVALAFLNSDTFDHDIDQKSARPQLIGLLQDVFEIDLPASIPLADGRQRLARHVLLTEFLTGLGEAAPPSLETIKIAAASPTREACISLAHAWRLRRDGRDNYVATAKQVEQTLGPSSFVISPSWLETKASGQRTLDQFETFPAIERALLQHVEHALLQSADATLMELAESRLCRFWSDVMPAIQAHWALIAATAGVLLQADRVSKALKKALSTVPTLIRPYAEGDAPWCLLDTAHRHMESRWYAFEPEPGADYGGLEQLIVKAEQRYTEVGSQLAQYFTNTFEKAKHPQLDRCWWDRRGIILADVVGLLWRRQ